MPSRKTKPAKKPAPKAAKPAVKKSTASRQQPAKRKSAQKPRAATKARPSAKPAPPAARAKPAAKLAPPAKTSSASLSIRDQKAALRHDMKETLAKMRERARRSKDICKAITDHPSWRRSIIIAIFAPMEMEPDVELLWKYAEGKTVCYPTIRMGGLDFISVGGPESVTVGQFGIREPVFDQARVIPPDTFDLVLVPGAAFTANGDRLGRGGGFYDRLLSSPGFRAFKVGVCFDRQVLDALPLEAHDQRVHRVVTESGWLQRPDFIRAGKPNA
jgi:5-formyltetrahydrofolate cyclo-ligase